MKSDGEGEKRVGSELLSTASRALYAPCHSGMHTDER